MMYNQTRQLILSGSIHYSRILPSDWEDVFLLAKELHLNTIQTYFFWNFHETTYNNVTWKGRRDLIHVKDNETVLKGNVHPDAT